MTADAGAAELLATLPEWAFAAVMLLARIGCASMLLPGIGELDLPMTVRAGFVVVFTALMLPVLAPAMPPVPPEVPRLVSMLAAEIVTGLWLGWLTRLILLALPMAGQVIASAIGMTSVLQPDAMLGAGAAALSRMFGLAAPVIVFASGMHAYALAALVGSYELVPPGVFLPVADTVTSFVSGLSTSFGLGLRLAAPFLMAGVLFNAGLALISRLVPALQTYFAAMPGQILGGLLLLGLLGSTMIATWTDAAREVFAALPGL